MACACCGPQCSIRSIATSIQFSFGQTQTRTNLSPVMNHPCFSSGVLTYCPSSAVPQDFYEQHAMFRQSRGVNFDAGSGACDRYDGTYVVDLATLPAALNFYWCTSAWFADCAGKTAPNGTRYVVGPYAMGSTLSYAVDCNGATATHSLLGYTIGVRHVAALIPVLKGAPAPSPPPLEEAYFLQQIVSGPTFIAASRVHDWYSLRYKANFRTAFLEGYDEWFVGSRTQFGTSGASLTSPAFCQVTVPDITLQ